MAFLLEETNLGRGKRKEVKDPGWETCVMGSLAWMYQTTLPRSPSRFSDTQSSSLQAPQ